jgi:tetratricopeptide (TPR) repeat protein
MCTTTLLLLLAFLQVDAQALEWFRKGEELIGTEEEFSQRQAEFFRKAVDVDPGFVAARFNLIVVCLRLQELEEALQQSDELVRLMPEDARSLQLRAQVHGKRGETEAAIADLERAAGLDPDNPEVWQDLGAYLYQERRLEDSLGAFRQALKVQPSLSSVYFDIALTHQGLGAYADAAKNYLLFLEDHPDDFQANLLLGIVLRAQAKQEEALHYLLKAESIRPDDPDTAEELAAIYIDLGDLAEAEKRLEKSVRDPFRLGLAAKEQQDWEKAARNLREASVKEPENASIWAHLGDVLAELMQLEEAVLAYQTALEKNPEDFNSLINLAALHGKEGRLSEAARLLEKAVELEPLSGLAHLNLALVQDNLGKADEAFRHYLAALDRGERSPLLHFRLAVLHSGRSEVDEALAHLTVAFEQDPARFVPKVLDELRNVSSDLDSIRYTERFNALLKRYRKELEAGSVER